MEEQFVPYELALKLKELGFNEECFGIYDCRECKIGGYINTIYYSNPPYKLPTISEKEVKYKESLLFKNHILAPIWQQAFSFLFKKQNLFNTNFILEFDGFDFYLIYINEDTLEKTDIYRGEKALEKTIEIVERIETLKQIL